MRVSEESNVPPAAAARDLEVDALPWSWKECSRARVQDAYDFCMTVKPPKWDSAGLGPGRKRDMSEASDMLGPTPASVLPFEGLDQVLAAVGLGSSPPPARRGVLSEDLFAGPVTREPSSQAVPGPSTAGPSTRQFADVIPRVVKRSSQERPISGPSAPLMSLPYPFTGRGAQVSSKDRVPFPPSPVPSGEKAETTEHNEEEADDGDVLEGDQESLDEGMEGDFEFSEEPSSGRASGSMSSLGQPVTSRYPFQPRRPTARTTSPSSQSPSQFSPQQPLAQIAQTQARDSPTGRSGTHSTPSRASQSTGNRDSTDSQSPMSFSGSGSGVGTSSGMPSPISLISHGGGIPMPPRHPHQGQGRGRARAGTAPSTVQMSPASVAFPRAGVGRPTHARTATETSMGESFRAFDTTMSFEDDSHYDDTRYDDDVLSGEGEGMMEQPEPEGPHEAAERDDIVGLLSRSAAPSPKTSLISLRLRGSGPHRRGQGRSSGSHSANGSRSNSHSGSSSSRSRSRTDSISALARSRAQSLVQSVGAASRSSLELVHAMRMRANSSMARLEEDVPPMPTTISGVGGPGSDISGGHSRSGSSSDAMMSSSENYTFGHPLRMQWPRDGGSSGRVEEETPAPETIRAPAVSRESPSRSNLSVSSPSERPSDRTISRLPTPEWAGSVPGNEAPTGRGRAAQASPSPTSSQADVISTAPPSLVTPAASVEDATDTFSSWGRASHQLVERPDKPGPM